ncbi:hypothetical protein [Teredinibacter purpureus]|uniref:hypothetical protein n=1 Tax=Teredinibacter purpureus TaxID=2731756 RepID=UPI0005F79B9B|nr:hypothetical protein [Teredinibacter purpureus]
MPEKRYITAVFEYDEGALLPKKLTEAFKSESMMFEDTRITAISLEDEISRAEKMEDSVLPNTEDIVYAEDGTAIHVIDRPSPELEKLLAKARSAPSKS